MRLIDADALPVHRVKILHAFGVFDGDVIFPEHVANAPTVEAEPVRHGRWYIPTGMMPAAHHGRHRCSVCGHIALHERPGKECLSAYCPNCFAKMDGKDIDVLGKICPATKLPCCDCVPGTPCAKMDGGE